MTTESIIRSVRLFLGFIVPVDCGRKHVSQVSGRGEVHSNARSHLRSRRTISISNDGYQAKTDDAVYQAELGNQVYENGRNAIVNNLECGVSYNNFPAVLQDQSSILSNKALANSWSRESRGLPA